MVNLYDGWLGGELSALGFALSNRGRPPQPLLEGTTLQLTPYQPPHWSLPEHRVVPFADACFEALVEYLRRNDLDFRGTPATRQGVDRVAAQLVALEAGLGARNDERQFWLCLARAFNLDC